MHRTIIKGGLFVYIVYLSGKTYNRRYEQDWEYHNNRRPSTSPFASNRTGNPSKMLPSFQTTFAVPLHCEACVKDVSAALREVDGIYSLA